MKEHIENALVVQKLLLIFLSLTLALFLLLLKKGKKKIGFFLFSFFLCVGGNYTLKHNLLRKVHLKEIWKKLTGWKKVSCSFIIFQIINCPVFSVCTYSFFLFQRKKNLVPNQFILWFYNNFDTILASFFKKKYLCIL